jgi:hypothetical protein
MDLYKEEYCLLEELNDKLERDGFAVISNVVCEQVIENCRNNLWETLGHISSNWETPINFENPDSYKGLYKLLPLHSMLIQYYGLGHSQFAWNIRSDENVANVFAKIWNCNKEDLIVSMDGISICMPPEITNRGWFRKTWYHTDQRFTNKNKSTIQGLVNLYDTRVGDSATKLLRYSHKYHTEFYNKFKDDIKYPQKDWYKISNEEQYEFFKEKNCEEVSLLSKAGDLVLWDSRTFHCGSEPLKEREVANFRATIYVCMSERKNASKKNLEKRKKIFNEMRISSHNPYNPTMFPKNPRTYGAELPQINPIEKPILSDFAKLLI